MREVANYANDSTDRLRENANKGGGPKSRKFCERNKWMPPYVTFSTSVRSRYTSPTSPAIAVEYFFVMILAMERGLGANCIAIAGVLMRDV